MRRAALSVLAVMALVAGLVGAGTAAAAPSSGPTLTVPAATLARSLACTGNLASGPTPVLLIPGTTLTPDEFRWNYVRAFTAAKRPFCTVELPNHAMSDIQTSAEYVVSAIRTMQQRAGRKISLVGHSQGGMIFRWAFKYWPDTRGDVDDAIGLAPSNHGTADANVVCSAPGGCAPSIWQQRLGSDFYKALNSGPETFPGVDYTVAYTEFDEVVFPNINTRGIDLPDGTTGPSSELNGASNVSLQSLCPAHPADHLSTGTSDAVAYAIALDALNNPGPANPGRIARTVCLAPFQPGVDPATFPTDFGGVVATAVTQVATYPHVPREPAVKPYAAG